MISFGIGVRKSRAHSLTSLFGKNARFQPGFMHPAVFIGSSVLLGCIFALQEWMGVRMWSSYHIPLVNLLQAWCVYYGLWGVLCWLLWWWLGPQLQRARLAAILTWVLPLSIVVSILQEMIWVACFPNIPLNRPHMGYWRRLELELSDEIFNKIVIFWCAFALFRGIGYYQRFREKEDAAAQLETRLANAQISALRMQLNPHFLFNTMNGISSLMRSDVGAADNMLDQLASLLRITLERGDAQLIPLRDELDFIDLYLSMQGSRFGARVRQSISVDPELHDALVPAMILQPIVENAYAHGLSRLDSGGILEIEARKEGDRVRLSVLNSGVGLGSAERDAASGSGLGLANVKARLRLHYGAEHAFTIREVAADRVQVTVRLPLQFSECPDEEVAAFGV
jgi:two-component system LytT family sensor kinase